MSDNFKNIGPRSNSKVEDKPNKGKVAQCYECEGFGHIKVKCPMFLKKHKKGMPITWSDSNNESEEEITNKVMAFTRK